MPLLSARHLPRHALLGSWQVLESEEWFRNRLQLHHEEEAALALVQGPKRLDWLAARYLIRLFAGMGPHTPCLKDVFGRPHLRDLPWRVSLSHTPGYAAVILSPVDCGIDIQITDSRMERLASKIRRSGGGCLDPGTFLCGVLAYPVGRERGIVQGPWPTTSRLQIQPSGRALFLRPNGWSDGRSDPFARGALQVLHDWL